MFFLPKKLWIAWSKVRFLRLPVERRVRLEVNTDGRHITFLLVSLYEAGYGVQVVGSPAVFRELICLRKSTPIPFVIGGKETECGISITDQPSTLDARRSTLFVLDYDYFSGLNNVGVSHGGTANTEVGEDLESGRSAIESDRQPNAGHSLKQWSGVFEGLSPSLLESRPLKTPPAREPGVPALASSSVLIRDICGKNSSSLETSHSPLATALRAPYFMHPSVYHRGLHKRHSPAAALVARRSTLDSAAKLRCRFRLGFFGTHDREFYSNYYHFPGMNRYEILEVFFQKFGDRITHLQGGPRDWEPCEVAVSIDSRGGDRKGKSFLSQDHYFEALQECDFVLSPPGWCMPVSHNLIEAMFCGAIPITNGGAFMAEPLKDGETCLAFENEEGLVPVIERALAMDADEVACMRLAVRDYYERFLEPRAFAEDLVGNESERVLVNAEENSVRFVFPGMVFPWDVPAEALRRGEQVSGANL